MSETLGAERKYRKTHRWITFRADLSTAGSDFWMHLGEARSKIEHLTSAILKPEVADELQRPYLAKGAHATTAIEGNSLSEKEVLELVEGRLDVAPSQRYLAQEVANIVAAFNQIAGSVAQDGSPALTTQTIKDYNALVLRDLELDEGVVPGEIRTHSVVVAKYRGAPAEDCEYLLDYLCAWLEGPTFETDDPDWAIPYALIKAMLAHLYLAWIHPFGDGNGRTARLLEFQILFAAGVPAPAAHLLSNFYNETRSAYYRQLAYASESGRNIVPFLAYGLQGFIDEIRTQLDRVWRQLYADRWEQYIYETFGQTHTKARERQRHLALVISGQDVAVHRRDIPRLSIDLAVAYATGTDKMVSRDLNALEKMGLIRRTKSGWGARKDTILAFRPFRREIASSDE